MCKIEGITVVLKKISFEKRGYITLYLEDGRILNAPLRHYPDIKKLTARQRDEWFIMDDQYFAFNRQPEVYSVSDFLTLHPENA